MIHEARSLENVLLVLRDIWTTLKAIRSPAIIALFPPNGLKSVF